MADIANQTTVIGPGTRIKGDMSIEGTARIAGSFEGRIIARGELQIADTATCKATVDAAKIVVDGAVEGNVTARERIELTAKAKLKGDLVAARLVIAEGATFTGHCTVGPEAAKAPSAMDGDMSITEPKAAAKGETREPVGARR